MNGAGFSYTSIKMHSVVHYHSVFFRIVREINYIFYDRFKLQYRMGNLFVVVKKSHVSLKFSSCDEAKQGEWSVTCEERPLPTIRR